MPDLEMAFSLKVRTQDPRDRLGTNRAQHQTIGTTALGLGMGTDVVTAASLCFFLRSLRTGYSKCVIQSLTIDDFSDGDRIRDDTIVNKLILYAVNTGILTR